MFPKAVRNLMALKSNFGKGTPQYAAAKAFVNSVYGILNNSQWCASPGLQRAVTGYCRICIGVTWNALDCERALINVYGDTDSGCYAIRGSSWDIERCVEACLAQARVTLRETMVEAPSYEMKKMRAVYQPDDDDGDDDRGWRRMGRWEEAVGGERGRADGGGRWSG